MKREILFRGRCIKSNEWVYGDLIHGVGIKYGNIYILPHKTNLAYVKHCDPLDGVQVLPNSVGQFANKLDIQGKKIFEGDYDSDGCCVIWCEECVGFEFAQVDIPTKDICIKCHRCDGNFFFQDNIKDFNIAGSI